MNTVNQVQPEIKVRKERNDKGKARLGYKTRLTKLPEQIVERIKRSYTFKNRPAPGSGSIPIEAKVDALLEKRRIPSKRMVALGRYESAIMKIVTDISFV